MAVMIDLLIGGPGETAHSARDSIALAKTSNPSYAGITLGVRVYPGSELADDVATQCTMDRNPALWGETTANQDLLKPVFYLSPQLGTPRQAASFLEETIGGDKRFFFGGSGDAGDYDYDDNQLLVDAIAGGARGAYWDILRQLR